MKNQDKICLFIPSLEGGGAERVFLNLANYLEKNKYNYNLLLGFKKGENLAKIINLKKIFSLNKRGRYFIFSFIKYLKNEKPTKIYSTLLSANFCNLFSKIFILKKSKRIIREANIIIMPKNIIKRCFIYLIYQFYYLADFIIVNSNDTKISLLKIVPHIKNKVTVIPNPVFFYDAFNIELNNKKFIDNEIPKFVGIGRLVDQKNFDLLIKAFNLVQKKNKSELLIVGEGPLKNDLINLTLNLNINDKVKFLHYQNNIHALFKNNTIFVLSSKYEGFGNVIVEALMNSVPVVSTNCLGGPLEILNNGEYGFIADQNIDDLANKMTRMLVDIKKNKIDYKKIQNRALNYTVEKIALRYFNL